MTASAYLFEILKREAVDTSINSPLRACAQTIFPIIQRWAGAQFGSMTPSGSFAKGTANLSGTDIDLFISLKADTTNTLAEIYSTLVDQLQKGGYAPRQQNVSIGVKINGYNVDLVPGKMQNDLTGDHSLYKRRADTWTKTNITKHISSVASSGLQNEIRMAVSNLKCTTKF